MHSGGDTVSVKKTSFSFDSEDSPRLDLRRRTDLLVGRGERLERRAMADGVVESGLVGRDLVDGLIDSISLQSIVGESLHLSAMDARPNRRPAEHVLALRLRCSGRYVRSSDDRRSWSSSLRCRSRVERERVTRCCSPLS